VLGARKLASIATCGHIGNGSFICRSTSSRGLPVAMQPGRSGEYLTEPEVGEQARLLTEIGAPNCGLPSPIVISVLARFNRSRRAGCRVVFARCGIRSARIVRIN
jgi:hypothetical protein